MKMDLPHSLAIAFCAVGALWIVGVVAFMFGEPAEIVLSAFGAGILAGAVEWLAIRRNNR